MIKNDIGLLISGDTIKRVFLYSMIARQSLKSSMRNAPAKRKFPQPRPENPLGAGQKTEPCISPIKLGHGTRTNVPHHARSMRRRPPLFPVLRGGAKDPARGRLSRQFQGQASTAGPDHSQKNSQENSPPPGSFRWPPSEPVAKSDSLCRTMSPFPRHYISIWTAAAMPACRSMRLSPAFIKILPVRPVLPALFLH